MFCVFLSPVLSRPVLLSVGLFCLFVCFLNIFWFLTFSRILALCVEFGFKTLEQLESYPTYEHLTKILIYMYFSNGLPVLVLK